MVGFHGGDPIGYAALEQEGSDAVPSSTGANWWETVKEGFLSSTGYRNAREEGRQAATTGVMATAEGISVMEPEAAVEAPVLESKYGIAGHLKFDKAMPDSVAKDLYDHKIDQLRRQNVYDRAEPGVLRGGAARFIGNAIGSLLDPINLAAGFIPVFPEARVAAAMAEAGSSAVARASVRGLVGGAEGAAGMAILEPLNYVLSRQEHNDYSMADALSNIALGSVLGGGLHIGVGSLVDRTTARARNPVTRALEDAGPEVRKGLLEGSLGQTIDGRPVDVTSALDAADATRLPNGIAGDIERKLIAAGRPVEEARAAGRIEQARYETHAARFEGRRGTAEEIYLREGADIVAGTPRVELDGTARRAAIDNQITALEVHRDVAAGAEKAALTAQITALREWREAAAAATRDTRAATPRELEQSARRFSFDRQTQQSGPFLRDTDAYVIRDETGAEVARAHITFDEGRAWVHMIDTAAEGDVGSLFGTSTMRAMARSFFRAFPEATELNGTRVSGARTEPVDVRVTREQIERGARPGESGEAPRELYQTGADERISTRVPWAKALEDAGHRTSGNIVGIESSRAAGAAFEKNAGLLKTYPGIRFGDAGTPETIVARAIEHMKGNLLDLFDRVPAAIRERSKRWYDGANTIAHQWAEQYGYSPRAVAGALAALSPQKDWFQNVDLARRIITTLREQRDTVLTPEMRTYADGYVRKLESSDKPAQVKAGAELRHLLDEEFPGKPLGEITDPYERAVWVRWFDEAHNDRSYQIVSPEGEFTGRALTGAGKPQRVAWGSFNEIAKAVSVLQDDSVENISRSMGGNHKVRNFYNNIISPNAPHGDVTIDTHAIAADQMRPLAGAHKEVVHGLGLGEAADHAATGSRGLYGVHAEAYRQAAAERGVLPREMQSITWEAIRGLFSPEQKRNAALVKRVEGIWDEYRKGTIDVAEARQRIVDAAGGITPPEWWRPGAEADAGSRAAAGPRDVARDELRGGTAAAVDGGTGGGGAATVSPEGTARELEQAARGSIRLGDPVAGTRALITLFRDADASTVLHETSHEWLERLTRDAARPDAPTGLVDDVATVRDWLGIKDGEPISTEAHEKFATAFEQYLREGKSPTPELQSIFDQFKAWLTRIYRTIAGLGTRSTTTSARCSTARWPCRMMPASRRRHPVPASRRRRPRPEARNRRSSARRPPASRTDPSHPTRCRKLPPTPSSSRRCAGPPAKSQPGRKPRLRL
jgi:hypothetical protein